MDRPTAGLKPDAAHDFLDACRRRAECGHAVVFTTHDRHLAAAYCHTLAVIVAGRLMSWGEPSVALVPAALRVLSCNLAFQP